MSSEEEEDVREMHMCGERTQRDNGDLQVRKVLSRKNNHLCRLSHPISTSLARVGMLQRQVWPWCQPEGSSFGRGDLQLVRSSCRRN